MVSFLRLLTFKFFLEFSIRMVI